MAQSGRIASVLPGEPGQVSSESAVQRWTDPLQPGFNQLTTGGKRCKLARKASGATPWNCSADTGRESGPQRAQLVCPFRQLALAALPANAPSSLRPAEPPSGSFGTPQRLRNR